MRSWTFELGLSSLALEEMFLTNPNARKYFIFLYTYLRYFNNGGMFKNNNKNLSRSKGEFKK